MPSIAHARALALALGAAVLGGCIDSFTGSNVQIDFSSNTPTAAPPGTTPGFQQPPENTYFTLYAVDEVRDSSDVVIQTYLFAVQRFEIKAAVDFTSPCFIDLERAPFPGLHISMFADKMREATGVADPLNPPSSASDVDVQQVVTADQRVSNADALTAVKVVVDVSTGSYPAVSAMGDCGNSGVIPHPTCTDDASNARRLSLCRAAWESGIAADLYEGNDKILTAPLNGNLFGFVQGSNPVNGAGLGGAQMFVDEVLHADSYAITWQFKDVDGDGEPDYPATFPMEMRSETGVPYMDGRPEIRTRGVVNALLVNPADPLIFAQLAVFADLGEDEVSF
jgi:hypothetical protein